MNTGYEEHTTKTKISNLFHMDSLKLAGKTEKELQKQMQTESSVTWQVYKDFMQERKISSLTKLDI
jgi:hypothetical protein